MSSVTLGKIAALVCLTAPLFAQQRVITTIAGAEWLFPSDGKPATQAALGGASSMDVAVDRAGNYYICDADNSIVVKVGPDGIANVIAGNGLAGISGDNGLAVNASLDPLSIAVDSAGNVIIGEFGGRIRKVSTDGIITTIAGIGERGFSGDNGPATQARLTRPYGLAFDAAGNLYFSDSDNQRIRKITPGGIISTIAGTGVVGFSGDGGPAIAARMNYPTRLVVDSAGNLYFADDLNFCVRKITPAGAISTVAGGGEGEGDGIPATGSFTIPLGVAVDTAGNLYIADGFESGVRRIDTSGIIRTIAGGGGNVGFSGDGGPALDAVFNFNVFAAIAVEPGGALLVCDNQNKRVRRITADQRITTVAGNGLYRFSGNGGPATSATLDFPSGLLIDPAGNIYISEMLEHRVRRIAPDGTISVFAGNGIQGYSGDGGPAVNASFSFPSYLALDVAGNVYIADTVNSVIRRVDTRGIISSYVPFGFLKGPRGIVFDPAGELIIADSLNHRLRFVNPAGTSIGIFVGTGTAGFSGDGGPASQARVNEPTCVTHFNGSIYFCDSENHRVRRVELTTQAIITTVAGNGVAGYAGDGGLATLASLKRPQGVTFDRDGNMYIADQSNQVVRKVAPGGIISTFAGSPNNFLVGDGGAATSAALGAPTDLAFNAAGDLLITTPTDHSVRAVLVAPPTFQVSSTSLAFTAPAGSTPQEQSVNVTGSIPGIPFTTSISPGATWLSVSPTTGFMPATLRLTADASALAAGTRTATVTINAANSIPTTITLTVSFTTTAPGQASLAVKPTSLVFPFVQNAAAVTRPLTILNQGGGSINFNLGVATSSGGAWLRASATSGTAGAFGSSAVNITADPARLGIGVYSGAITISSTNPAQSVTVGVTMTISAVQQTILIPQTGLTFFAVQGGGQTLPQFFNILNTGAGQMPFSVKSTTLTGGNWLSVFPGNGTSDVNSPIVPAIRVDVNPGSLGPGVYSGNVQVTAPGADNSPQFVSIFLNVLPPGSRVGPLVQPSGIIFSAVTGAGDPGSQVVTLQSLSSTPVTFQAACVTEGGNWCKALPLEGTITPVQPLRILIQPQTGGLAPNVYRGSLTISFSDGTTRSVALLLVILPSGAVVTSSEIRGATSNCTPTKLVPTFAGILGGAPAAVGFPGQVLVKVVDDCANPMASGTVTVNFDNGDLPLSLTSLKDGGWATTWAPSNPATTVTLTATAEIPELKLKGTVQSQAGFVNADAPPQVGAGAILNAASNAIDSPVAPGSLISIYGARMTQGTAQFTSVPLPTTLANSSVFIAGSEAGLTFASASQINAQLPYETAVNTTQQALVQRGNNFSAPMPFTVAAAAPGIFTNGTAQGLVFVADPSGRQTLADAANPAKAGDALVIYCTGLGQVTPSVPSGQAAPLTQVSSTVVPVTATIGGVSGSVFFSGLTPGFVGLYQVNVTLPPGVQSGNGVPVVITAAGQSSRPVTIAVR